MREQLPGVVMLKVVVLGGIAIVGLVTAAFGPPLLRFVHQRYDVDMSNAGMTILLLRPWIVAGSVLSALGAFVAGSRD